MKMDVGQSRLLATLQLAAVALVGSGMVAFMLGAGGSDAGDDGSAAVVTTTGEGPKSLEQVKAQQWQVVRPGENSDYNQRERLVNHGQLVYAQHCAGCHGDKGDGNGPAAERLLVKPRNFTAGVFKFRSTRQLQLPLEADLHRIITKGLPGASMPSFPLMSERDKIAVIEYIKTFYADWESRAAERQVVTVPQAPADLGDSKRIDRGRVVYLAMQCGLCHGLDGAGTKATVGEVTDSALGSIRPRNFTYGRFRGGDDPQDVYRTFHTGLGGAMPKFDESVILYVNQETVETQKDHMYSGELERLQAALSEFPKSAAQIMEWSTEEKQQRVVRNSWDLVAYVLSLTKDPRPTAAPPASAAAPPGAAATDSGTSGDTNGADDYGY